MKKSTNLLVLALMFGALVVGVVLFGGDIVQAASCDETVSPGGLINTAIGAASVGDTVCVKAGVYKENVDVNVEDLVLRGVGVGTEYFAWSHARYSVPTRCSLFEEELTCPFYKFIRIENLECFRDRKAG